MSIRIGLVILLMGIVYTFVSPAHAVSESAVISLLIPPGARASGMGEAFVATADDACATFWNPAGLAFTSGGEITLMKMEWLPQLSDDLHFYSLLGRISLGRYGTVGFNNIIFDGGSSLDNSAAIFYSRKVQDNWAIGAGVRYIHSDLGSYKIGTKKKEFKAEQFSFDVSSLYKFTAVPGLRAGFNLSNIGGQVTYTGNEQGDPLPTNLKVGLAYDAIQHQDHLLTFNFELNKLMVNRHSDGSFDPWYKALFSTPWTVAEKEKINIGDDDEKIINEKKLLNAILGGGVEYWFAGKFAFRTGYYWDRPGKVECWSIGGSVLFPNFRLDGAFIKATNYGPPMDYNRRIGVSIFSPDHIKVYPCCLTVAPTIGMWPSRQDYDNVYYQARPTFGMDILLQLSKLFMAEYCTSIALLKFEEYNFNSPRPLNGALTSEEKSAPFAIESLAGLRFFYPPLMGEKGYVQFLIGKTFYHGSEKRIYKDPDDFQSTAVTMQVRAGADDPSAKTFLLGMGYLFTINERTTIDLALRIRRHYSHGEHITFAEPKLAVFFKLL